MCKSIITFLFASVLFIQPVLLVAQEEKKKFIGLESGYNYYVSESKNFDFIRGSVDVSTFGIGDDSNSLSVDFQNWYVGAKSEYRFHDNKLGLLCGIRFSEVSSFIKKSTSYASNLNFFYLLNKQEGTTTEFLKVKQINQNSKYLGVPVELRYFLFNIVKVRVYLKGSAEFNYRLKTNTNVMFYNPEMEPFEAEVEAKFDEPADFHLLISGGGGLKLGDESKTNLSLEAIFFSQYLSDKISGLAKPVSGGGFQVNVQIPF
jgi:hypothetical protein